MICILSQSYLEDTTDSVMDWLGSFGAPFVRINGGDIDRANGPRFSLNNDGAKARIAIDGAELALENVKVVWYRRWAFNNKHMEIELLANPADRGPANIYSANRHLNGELRAVSAFLFSTLDDAKWLGHPSTASPNKLTMLRRAARVGLDVPDTLVTTNVRDLHAFIEKHGEVICKPSGEVLTCTINDRPFGAYTSTIPDWVLDQGQWTGCFPSLFQEKLEKKYEIRVFYLDGQFYGMAMFTQQKASTRVDFRHYSLQDPVRTVPYKLPDEVEARLGALMKASDLSTGSIDLVRTVDGRFVFLEVNPVGQFGMVSQPCNYYLEKKVANALMERLYG
ncbi:MAG TPA: grasp-with-spasm system ATP-grasp peptide maturase [Blastocatellia bacterium]|nr:grasp-with-spasm system ATP-grasp peptide maturase [Blastocatellia bacterium]